MKPVWKIGLRICTAGFTAALIERSHPGEYTFRKPMVGNGRSGSRRWRTRLSNRPWSRSSIRFMRRTFGVSRMVSGQGEASIKRWMRCTSGSTRKKVNWVLDADIRGFFDNLSTRVGC